MTAPILHRFRSAAAVTSGIPRNPSVMEVRHGV
jgi:hypothetical protein